MRGSESESGMAFLKYLSIFSTDSSLLDATHVFRLYEFHRLRCETRLFGEIKRTMQPPLLNCLTS